MCSMCLCGSKRIPLRQQFLCFLCYKFFINSVFSVVKLLKNKKQKTSRFPVYIFPHTTTEICFNFFRI
jgi:protein-arginine kinase activator protein McsA